MRASPSRSHSPVPTTPQHQQQQATPRSRLLEPSSTPRARSRTVRPAGTVASGGGGGGGGPTAGGGYTPSPQRANRSVIDSRSHNPPYTHQQLSSSVSPIKHGVSFRSVDDHLSSPAPAKSPRGRAAPLASSPSVAAAGGGAAQRKGVPLPHAPRERLSGTEADALLAEADRRMRRGGLTPTATTATHTSPGRSAAQHRPLQRTTPDYDTTATASGDGGAPRPLSLALRAQWALLLQQQDQQQHNYSNRDGSAVKLHAAMERDLVRSLAALPLQDPAAVNAEAAELAPYLVAFAAAPVPSPRSQAVALAALQGLLTGLPAVWGRARAAAFVRELFLGDHGGLAALDAAFAGGTVGSVEGDGGGVYGGDWQRRGSDGSGRGNPARPPAQGREGGLRSAIIDSVVALLLFACRLCPAVDAAVLGRPSLLRALVRHLPAASIDQAGAVATLLLTLMAGSNADARGGNASITDVVDGVGRASAAAAAHSSAAARRDSARVLAGYGAHHAILNRIRAAVRATFKGRGEVLLLSAEATAPMALVGPAVGSLCQLIKAAVQLSSGAPGAFTLLAQEEAFAALLGHLLTLPWGDVVELACLWVVALLSSPELAHAAVAAVVGSHPDSDEEGEDDEDEDEDGAAKASPNVAAVLARNLAAKTEVVQTLTRLLGWRDAASFSYATSAALCWRWLFLASGGGGGGGNGSGGAPLAEAVVNDPDIIMSFIHAILTNPLPGKASSNSNNGNTRSLRDRALFTVELVVGLACSFARGSDYTRAATHLLLLERLTPEVISALGAAVRDVARAIDDSYFDDGLFPAIALDADSELAEVMTATAATGTTTATAASSRFMRSGSSTGVAASSASSSSSRYRSKYMQEGGRGAATVAGKTSGRSSASSDTRSRGRSGSAHSATRDTAADSLAMRFAGAGDILVGTPYKWRLLVEASWAVLLSGEPTTERSTGPASTTTAMGRGGRQGTGVLALRPVGDASSVSASPSASGAQLRLLKVPTAAAATDHTPWTEGHTTTTTASAGRARRTPPAPPYTQCGVVVRASLLADGGDFYRESIQAVLRLAHQYVKSGVIGQSQLSVTGGGGGGWGEDAFDGGNSDSRGDNDGARRARSLYALSAFSVLLDEEPRYAPLVATAMAAASNSHRNPNSSSISRSLRSNSIGSTRTSTGGGGAGNPWAPARAARPSRRWQVGDLQRSDVLLFAVSYETLVTDLAEAIAATEAHVSFLRAALQVCPTRALTRRLLLNDLYMNVYPKIHLFLRYIQRQAGLSRAALMLLSEEHDGGVCVHTGNVARVYDAIGHCVGNA